MLQNKILSLRVQSSHYACLSRKSFVRTGVVCTPVFFFFSYLIFCFISLGIFNYGNRIMANLSGSVERSNVGNNQVFCPLPLCLCAVFALIMFKVLFSGKRFLHLSPGGGGEGGGRGEYGLLPVRPCSGNRTP